MTFELVLVGSSGPFQGLEEKAVNGEQEIQVAALGDSRVQIMLRVWGVDNREAQWDFIDLVVTTWKSTLLNLCALKVT